MKDEPRNILPDLTLTYLISELGNAIGRRASVLHRETGEGLSVEELGTLVNAVILQALTDLEPNDEIARLTLAAEYGGGVLAFSCELDPVVEAGAEKYGFGESPRAAGDPLH